MVSAAEFHRPKVLAVENVAEFRHWLLFPAWQEALRALGYTLSVHVLDAADYGVPQFRERLLIIGTRSKSPLRLPLRMQEHVPISTVIRFDQGKWSPIVKPGRAEASLARIARGRARFGEQFVAPYYGSGSGQTGRSIHRPIGTITTLARWAVINGDRMRMLTVDETRAAMGFPGHYRLPSNTRTANMLLGNAVAPPMAKAAITAIMEAA